MDDILDIRSLSRVNKELKAMDRYFESIQKRARNFGLSSFQRQKIVIDQTTESVKRLSNALSNLTSRLYKINRLARNLSGIKIAVKCACSKDCSKCRSTCHSKMGSSNGINHSLTNLQKKITSQLGLQNKVNINKSSAPGVPLKTSTSNSPSKSVISQSSATKNTEKEKIVVIKPVMNTMAFIKKFSKVNDAVESLNKTIKAYKAITPSQVAAMPSWLQTAKTKIDDVVNRIKTSTIYTRAASMYSGAPSWVKTGLKGAGKIAKSAIVVADVVYDASEILNATGEEKYKLIGEFVGSKIGNIVGKSVGGATVAIPYVGPVIAPIASLVLGAAGEWLGGIGGGKIMEKVWYAKTHLKGWTKSLNEGIDTTTKDFKQSMNGFNNEVANKTNNIKTTAPVTIDSWSNKIVNFIGNKSESAIGIVENITGKLSKGIPLSSDLTNNMKGALENKINGVSNRLKGYVPGLAEGVKEKINNISEGTKNFSNKLNNFVQKNADPFKEKVKKATSKTSDFLQMILDSPEKLNWELIQSTEKTAAKKSTPNKYSRTLVASSRTYRANDRHRTAAVHSVKNTNRNKSNMQVNMPTGAIQVAVGERVNFDALASEVGKRFVAGFRQAMDNNKTARALV
ncbi:transcriptional regulator [Paenibacillus ottowii]|uniref:Transcriptional regulator n=1 Tax=Paenibacillus ottowii TaxID=2315729 RepID=A0ABY3B9L5_9BACL|nr:transcriptional regulator [Paenibacillus ottowii]TQS01050.1 transcriptional regulator [Paenibacillus ottowii]